MDDVYSMRRYQCRGDLNGDLECVIDIQVENEALAQRLTFDEFSGDKPVTICFANLINRENVRMIECRSGARFLLKATQTFAILREVVARNFSETLRCSFVSSAR